MVAALTVLVSGAFGSSWAAEPGPDAGLEDASAAPEPPDRSVDAGGPDSPEVGTRSADESPSDEREAPSAGRDDEASSGGVVIADVDLFCDLDRCNDPVEVEKLLDIAGLYPGREFDERIRETARERLEKTGLFKNVEFQTEMLRSGAVGVSVRAEGTRRIRKIQFEGVDPPPFRSDLRKLLIYRGGEPFEDEPSKKNTQLASLESTFEKEGFFGTEVELVANRVPGSGKFVDLVFKVDKGRRLYICDMGFRGLEALSYSDARQQILSSASFFARQFEIVRAPYTTENFKEGQEALVQRYREIGHFRARVTDSAVRRRPAEKCVTLMVEIAEGPHWELEFEGNSAFGPEELRRELPFFESGYVDAEEIERASRAIQTLYQTRGYPFASVEGEEIRRDRLHRTIRFEIEEGERLEIGDVRIHGNTIFSDRQLRSELRTKEYALFEPGGFFQTEEILSDLRRIEKKYRERGYLQVVAGRFGLEVRAKRGDLVVHIYIEEGPKTSTEEVRLEGVRSVTWERVRRELEIRSGEAFVPVQVRADQSRLSQLYSSVGYPLAEVETTCASPAGGEVPCERPKLGSGCAAEELESLEDRCEWRESDGRRRRVCQRVDPSCSFGGGIEDLEEVRVIHRVEEGPLVTTGEFLFQGNFRTRTGVIDREIPLESDAIFDVRKILRGQRNLRSLGIFDSVSIEAIGMDESASVGEESEASLLVSVEESQNRSFEFKFGFEGRNVLSDRQKLLTTGEVGYSDRNLLGSALQLEPTIFSAVDLLQLTTYGSTSVRDQEFATPEELDYLVGAELPLRHPRFLKRAFGIDKLHLTVTPFYMLDLLGVSNDQLLREEWGLLAEVRKDLSEFVERLFVSFGIEGKQAATAPLDGPVVDGERVFSPRRVTGKLIPKVTFDRRDSPLNPSRGYFLQLQPELVSGDALSPEIDTIDDSYLRLNWKGDVFVPMWERTVLAQSLRLGQIVPLFGRETRVPADERFFLGGAGSVRGYPNNSLGPRLNRQPAGGEFLMNYNIEFRYPILSGASLRGATFFDAGFLVDCFSDDDVSNRVGCYEDAFDEELDTNVRTAAGVGIRYIIADQIPVLLDYGIALDRRDNEGIGNLHFHLGYTF